MAITVNAIEVVNDPVGGNEWFVSAYSADFSGGEDLKDAEAGKNHYISKIQIFAQSVTDITFTIGAGQDTGITTTYLGPIPLPDAGGGILIDFGRKFMKVATNTALSIDASASCPATVLVWGKTYSVPKRN